MQVTSFVTMDLADCKVFSSAMSLAQYKMSAAFLELGWGGDALTGFGKILQQTHTLWRELYARMFHHHLPTYTI